MEPHCNENEPEKQKRVRRDARFAPRVGRQMRLDLRKLRFRQPKLVATHLCLLFGSRESRHYVRANTFMGPDPREPKTRSRSRIRSVGADSQGNASVIWRAIQSAVGLFVTAIQTSSRRSSRTMMKP